MTMFQRTGVLALCTAVALAVPAFAQGSAEQNTANEAMPMPSSTSSGGTATIGSIEVSEAWTRQTPPRARAGGAYARITNTGEEADVLIGGSAPFAGRVEIHEMAVTDGVMTMRELDDGLSIPPGETVELRPGSFHVMLLDINEPPVEGASVPVTLVFERAGEVTIDLPVAAIGATSLSGEGGGMSDMDHGSMGHDAMDHGSMSSDAMPAEDMKDMPETN